MTVKELKQKLAECDDDTLVLVRGYEEGVDEVVITTSGFCSDVRPMAEDWEGLRVFGEQKDNYFKNKAVWLRAGR